MTVRVRVAAIAMEGDRVLLVSTKRGAPGYLVPPGGGLEADETIPAAIAREVAEEAGLAVQAGALLAYRELWHGAKRTLELYLAAHLLPGQEQAPPTEGRTIAWVPCQELGQVPHFPEQLAHLCELARQPDSGAVYLGRVVI